MARWDVMAEQYHPDSLVDISWIRTNGPEFVRLSRQSFEGGGRSCHVLSPVRIQVNGDRRATADTGAVIAGPIAVADVKVFLTAYSRISELKCVYQFDYLTPVNPDQPVDLDPARLPLPLLLLGLSHGVEETRGRRRPRRPPRRGPPGDDRRPLQGQHHLAQQGPQPPPLTHRYPTPACAFRACRKSR